MKRQAQAGEIDLFFLDESGFAPTCPPGYTWARVGMRPIVPYEAPEGRRVNALGAFAPWSPSEPLVYATFPHTIQATHFIAFVWHQLGGISTPLGTLPNGFQRPRPCVVVLDNYSVHKNKEVQAAHTDLAAVGIRFFFLPPYRPDLNLIEPVWRHVKHEGMPVRSYQTLPALRAAVNEALHQRNQRLRQPCTPTGAGTTLDLSTTSLSKAA